jgi:hypothetical protein
MMSRADLISEPSCWAVVWVGLVLAVVRGMFAPVAHCPGINSWLKAEVH